jgi:preprotein translocase subunit SecE
MSIPQRAELRRKLLNVGWFILGMAISVAVLFLVMDWAVRWAFTR